jgi:hypothetical protein
MSIDEILKELAQWASEGALGAYEGELMEQEIAQGIQTLRDRIDELGGYHDDV